MKKTLLLAALAAASINTYAATIEGTDETTKYLARAGEISGIAWEMQVAGVDLCGDRVRYLPGFYRMADGITGDSEIPVELLEAFDSSRIIAVYPGSPAEAGGLKPGDTLVAINGKTIPENRRFTNRNRREAFTEEALEKAEESAQPLILTVDRDGQKHDVTITPIRACDIGVIYMPRIFHTMRQPGFAMISPLVDQFEEKWQVQAFIAPEIAVSMSENIRRRESVRRIGGFLEGAISMATGTDIQGITALGTTAWYSKPIALEGDRKALYLLARIGVDVTQVPDFWINVYNLPREGTARTFFGLRPSLEDRLEAMNEVIPLILEKQANGEPLIPASVRGRG